MTHKERVLELLSDGEPHTHHEGYALRVMLHSRVSDLRRDGYQIECEKTGGEYTYRLLGTVQPERGCVGDTACGNPSLTEPPLGRQQVVQPLRSGGISQEVGGPDNPASSPELGVPQSEPARQLNLLEVA